MASPIPRAIRKIEAAVRALTDRERLLIGRWYHEEYGGAVVSPPPSQLSEAALTQRVEAGRHRSGLARRNGHGLFAPAESSSGPPAEHPAESSSGIVQRTTSGPAEQPVKAIAGEAVSSPSSGLWKYWIKDENRTEIRLLIQALSSVTTREAVSAKVFHAAVEHALVNYGWTVRREWPITRSDGQTGRIDLLVVKPFMIALELDWRTPRGGSILKLIAGQDDWLTVVLLREAFDEAPQLNGLDAIFALQHRPEKARRVLTDEAYGESLRGNPAYRYLDLDVEVGKMDAWLLANPGRQKTRRFMVNWLNRAADRQRPVEIKGKPLISDAMRASLEPRR